MDPKSVIPEFDAALSQMQARPIVMSYGNLIIRRTRRHRAERTSRARSLR